MHFRKNPIFPRRAFPTCRCHAANCRPRRYTLLRLPQRPPLRPPLRRPQRPPQLRLFLPCPFGAETAAGGATGGETSHKEKSEHMHWGLNAREKRRSGRVLQDGYKELDAKSV